jgi:hypothetical protein
MKAERQNQWRNKEGIGGVTTKAELSYPVRNNLCKWSGGATTKAEPAA